MRVLPLMKSKYWTGIFTLLLLFFLSMDSVEAAPSISLRVTGGEVRDVLLSLARLSGANLLIDDSVAGKITVEVDDLAWEEALGLIARLKGLEYYRFGDVVIVGKKGMVGRNFGSLHVFKLRFADPARVIAAAALALGERRSSVSVPEDKLDKDRNDEQKNTEMEDFPSGRLSIDKATNALLFYGVPEEVEIIRKLLLAIDIPYQQVSLEAKVVAINKEAAKNLGIEWEWSKLPQSPERTTEYETITTTVMVDGKPQTITEQKPKETVTRRIQNGDSTPGIISFGHGPDGYPFELYYAARLNALVAEGKANILAKPNVMTVNGNEAVINIGGEIPVPTVSTTNATTTTSFEYREAGIILRYTPRINEDGYITADVHTEVSSPEYIADLKAYRFYKRSVDTVVRLKDGETLIIGGLIGIEERRSMSKIPFLGDLPVLGQFFRNTQSNKNESEVVIFLTAHIVN